jgi:nucleoside-diphosphate-sugar epimerase
MLVALTGASGFIGSYTAKALHQAGHRVRALVRSTSRRDHIEPYVAEFHTGEFDDPKLVGRFVEGADAVIHNALHWSTAKESDDDNFEKNVTGSLRLLEAARLAGGKQFLFVSSCAVHHEILPGGRIDENHPTWPNSVYGACKAAVEPLLKAYHFTYGMNTSAWRPAAVYGVDPNLERSQWHDLIKAAKNDDTISTDKGGKITHVQDVADALTLAIGDEQVSGQFYNIIDGYMYWQVAPEIAKQLTRSKAVIEDRKGRGPQNHFDTSKAIGFFDRHNNRAALRRGVEGVRNYVAELLPLI